MGVIGSVICITAIAGVGGTGLGGCIAALLRKDSSRTVSLLLSFAAGVMTSVVCFDLLSDALEGTGESAAALWWVLAGVVAGYAVIALLNAWIDRSTNHEVAHIDKTHPKTADSLEELIHADHYLAHERKGNDRSQLFVAGMVMAAAIALHNMPEGMVIGASFAKDAGTAALSRGGMVMAAVIGLHNIPEGMAVAVPLIAGGMPTWRAVGITAASGMPTILGAIVGYYLGAMGPLALALSLSFASGAMLYVVFGELLPESILMWRSKVPAFATVVGMLVGVLIIYA